MHLQLGRKGGYSVDIVMFIAGRPSGERCKAREIAAAVRIPAHYLPQVLADLVRGGILVSEAGPNGGYRLARGAADITLLDLVQAAEGAIDDHRCQLTGELVASGACCALHEPWERLRGLVIRELQGTTVADLSRTPLDLTV